VQESAHRLADGPEKEWREENGKEGCEGEAVEMTSSAMKFHSDCKLRSQRMRRGVNEANAWKLKLMRKVLILSSWKKNRISGSGRCSRKLGEFLPRRLPLTDTRRLQRTLNHK
jgi:hypothetical protein